MTDHATHESDRLGLLLAILLALTGLFGALVAWRLSDADLDAADAARAGLAATREQSRAVITAEAEVIQSQAAWLRYELARRRAEALTQAGQPVEALRAAKEAASQWAFVSGRVAHALEDLVRDIERQGPVRRDRRRRQGRACQDRGHEDGRRPQSPADVHRVP